MKLPSSIWLGWLPLVVLPLSAILLHDLFPPWGLMWVLAFFIYFSLKWLTWWRARNQISHSAWRSFAYLLAWPGMDADTFLVAERSVPPPSAWEWIWALFKTAMGATIIFVVIRHLPENLPLLRGWAGMLGLVLLLHFGSFHFAESLLAYAWG